MSAFEVIFIWVILIIFVDCLDKTVEKADSSPRRMAINSTLFSCYRRRFVIYFMVYLLMPVEFVRLFFIDFLSSPLLYMSYLAILFLVVILGSNFHAKTGDRRLKRLEISNSIFNHVKYFHN